MGKTSHDLFPKELAEKYTADDKRVIDTGEVFDSVESHQVPATAETIYVRVLKTPVRNSAGEIIGVQGIFWDVTERQRMEELLTTRAAELEAVTQVSTAAAAILDPDQLLQEVVDLTKERFQPVPRPHISTR